jgi:hypothetical protein
MKQFLAIGLAALLAGCGTLIPKRVEFFQDKVKTFPEQKAKETETQREAAKMASEKATETLVAAVSAGASTKVTEPAKDTMILTESVSRSLGPPQSPSVDPAAVLALKLDAAVAKLNTRIDDFKKDSNENAGKKIEGTGLFSVPYFIWIGMVLVFVFIGFILLAVLWSFIKMYALSNPPLQLGMNAVKAGSGFLKKALVEVTKGGEEFKDRVLAEVKDPEIQAQIKKMFKIEHERAQSSDTKAFVKQLTSKII